MNDICGVGTASLDPRCLGMDGVMVMAMMLPSWWAAGTAKLKPAAGYLAPWLTALITLVSAQAALSGHPQPAALIWALPAVGIALCLLPRADRIRAQPAADFRAGAKQGCGCLGANIGAILPMAILDMSMPAFIVITGSMAACQVAPRKLARPLMALSLAAGFTLSSVTGLQP